MDQPVEGHLGAARVAPAAVASSLLFTMRQRTDWPSGRSTVAKSGVAPQGVVAYVHCDHLLLIPEVYELTGTITPHQNYCFDHQLVVVGYPVRRASAGVEVRTRTKYIRIRRRPGLRATIVLCDC